jgi:hypothetical protein
MTNYVTLSKIDNQSKFSMLEGVLGIDDALDGLHTSSFASKLPNEPWDIDLIRSLENNTDAKENNTNGGSTKMLNWPSIGSSPINEYNVEGLFNVAFPTLFLRGEADWLQTKMRNFHLHEYEKHLLRYRDNNFGRHPLFRCFLLNTIMRHRAQDFSVVLVKKDMIDLPTTMEELREHLQNLTDS